MKFVIWSTFILLGIPLLLQVGLYSWALLNSFFAESRIKKNRDLKSSVDPSVYIVTCLYNEESIIKKKILNLLDLDYHDIKYFFVDDSSDDNTVAVINSFEDERIVLLKNVGRGKTEGQNTALSYVPPNSIVVFTDCNVLLKRDSIQKLVAYFENDSFCVIGGLCGNVTIRNSKGKKGIEGIHWDLEKKIKMLESRFGSVMGFDGGFYAIRSELYRPLPPDALSDFEEALYILAQGYKILFCEEAQAHEIEDRTPFDQFNSRRRVTLRTLWALRRSLPILPRISGWGRFFLAVNKFCRYICYYTLPLWIGLLVFLLWETLNLSKWLIVIAAVICLPAAMCFRPISTYMSSVILSIGGTYAGLYDFILGRHIVTWKKQRQL